MFTDQHIFCRLVSICFVWHYRVPWILQYRLNIYLIHILHLYLDIYILTIELWWQRNLQEHRQNILYISVSLQQSETTYQQCIRISNLTFFYCIFLLHILICTRIWRKSCKNLIYDCISIFSMINVSISVTILLYFVYCYRLTGIQPDLSATLSLSIQLFNIEIHSLSFWKYT